MQFKEDCISNFSKATAVFMLPSAVESVDNNKLLIYPNPATNFINISNNETIYSISISDIKGSLIFSKSYQENNISIDVSKFDVGIYTVKVVSMYSSSVQKLIIE